jgi:menaquinone reductase, integral membrane subunit
MLTEVTFCITCYLLVLCLEYIPILLRNRQLRKLPSFAGVRTSTAQARARPRRRGHLALVLSSGLAGWTCTECCAAVPSPSARDSSSGPRRFFLFILSAIATGPSFLMLVTAAVERVTGKQLVPRDLFRRLGFISGVLLGIYVAAKSIDTLIWLNITSPAAGFAAWQYYIYKPFGTPILFLEIVLFGLLPAFLLTYHRTAAHRGWLLSAAALACGGVLLNRFVLTVQTLALPTLQFDEFLHYTPSWQEVASFGGVIAWGVIVYSLSYRYLPMFPPLKGEDTHVSGN